MSRGGSGAAHETQAVTGRPCRTLTVTCLDAPGGGARRDLGVGDGGRLLSFDAEQARALLPVVQFMVSRPGLADTVWRQATAAELLLHRHRHRLDGAPLLAAAIASYAATANATPFQVSSMRDQLALLRDLGDLGGGYRRAPGGSARATVTASREPANRTSA